jgi:dolichol-phosphate mannosyltransferase
VEGKGEEVNWAEAVPYGTGAARLGMLFSDGQLSPRPTVCEVTVLIPTRNEAANVGALRDELSRVLAGHDYEVVVVDDSNDGETRLLLNAVSTEDHRWTIIARHPEEQTGLATAVMAGISAARGDVVCVMDGDLQHPPDIIPRLLAAVANGADLAVASRYIKGGTRAGLAGPSRLWVSRACTWLAQLIFPEARRTTDPLTGFFCCKRKHVAGLELRPMGFKILLELLVCAPQLKVVDIPFKFGIRHAGESKASTRQGVLFLSHLVSLFVYVPGSARGLKSALVTSSGLAVFFGLLVTLMRGGLSPIPSWLVASVASLGCAIAFDQIVAFRDVARHGEPDGARIHYPVAVVAALGSFTLFAVLSLAGRHLLLAAAVVAQGFGVIVMASLEHPWVWSHLRSRRPLPLLDLDRLARHLGAQRAIWTAADEPVDPALLEGLGKLVTWELVASVGKSGQPLLVIERPSPRPQPRTNIDSRSALIIPRLGEQGEIVAVAVLARRGRHPLGERQLDKAMAWMGSQNRWPDSEVAKLAIE